MDTVPVLNPADLTKGWLDNGPHIAIVLFDEVEKASPALWQLLLGIMDKAEVTTGKKEKLNLNCVMLFMTSNVGSREITQDNIGFTKVDKQSRSKEIDVLARAAARKKFPPEFMGRLDDIITFKELDKDALNQILDLEIDRVWQRATGTILKASENTPIKNVFTYSLTTAARNFLLAVDNENKYGARPIRRAVEKYVSQATCTFLATKQIRYPGTILIDKEKNKEQLTFALKMFDPTDIVVVPGLLDEIINKEK
jgi:ATP-dependent Clp protease ATP-binding subunit ClpA